MKTIIASTLALLSSIPATSDGAVMNLANSMEIEKIRAYWRAKGFTRPEDFSIRLERNDCQIVYRYRSWQMIENGETKAKANRLYNLLSSIT